MGQRGVWTLHLQQLAMLRSLWTLRHQADVVLHAPVLPATSSVLPSVATNPVASNTRPGAPVSSDSPLNSAPSHGRFILPFEKIERLSRKPTRAQVVQVTTNLLRDSCP
jgi:hypothetical protein